MGAMWESSKQSISAGDNSLNLNAGGNIYLNLGNIPTELVDDKIKEEVEKLKKSRFFIEFDSYSSSLGLGVRLINGNLSGGSNELKCRALAWCARLSCLKDVRRAEEFLELAKTLGDYPETKIAEAFIFSQKGDKAAALRALIDIDSGASHSAGLMTVAHHEGAEGSLSWMNDAGYTVRDLDSDGKSFLLSHQLQLGRWGEIAQTVSAISEKDFEDTPILHHLVALATLVPTVPQDFRAIVLNQIPFEAKGFPLASDAVAMNLRRAAHKHFINGFEAATQLSCLRTAKIDDEYALWLELLDPSMSAQGINRLGSKLRDPDTALGVVNYALQFGITLDIDRVERDIDREIARNGGITVDAAIARFALAFTKPTAEEAAHYIARHHNQLATHIDPKVMQFRQIEMFSRAGLILQANDILGQLIQQGITVEEERNLRWIISEAQGNDHIESRVTQYRSNGGLDALINLVVELEKHQHWDELCEFGRLLFDETHYLRDAERLVNAFNNTHRSAELVNFLKENVDLLSQSKHLHISYAWGLYHEGAFLECRAELAKLSDEANSPNYRALRVNLGIAMGDWDSLSAYIADEYRNRGDRSSHDLIGTAQLALHLGLHQAKDLVFDAAAKANDDSAILAAAYFIATSAGWEDAPQVFQWLEKAVELSGDDGPLQRMSLKDIFDRKPEWDRRESETWRLLAQGKIPIFVAAESLNRTLIDLKIFPALANLTETDPRRRSAIPAYSGKRVPLEFDVGGKTVALDATALLTLSFLNILDLVLDAFDAVYIPHSTLGWLFEERQKTTFHQPSRIANAHEVRNLLAKNVLQEFMPSSVASSDLSAQVGDDLAALIAEAENLRYADGIQHIVVRSSPVHRLSSLMAEEADLSAYAAILSSCLAVVEKLRQKGQLTANEEKRARAYLQLHEKPWPNQPHIADGAALYLDDLAITYFQHLGLLGKLKAAGLKAVVSQRVVSETDALISYERTSEEVKDVIERIRTSLYFRIESGRAKVNRKRNYDEVEEKAILEHPTVEIIAIAPHCDAVIVDDRFINQHENIDTGGNLIPILSTLDLLDVLTGIGIISDEDRLENRTRLRRAGFFFIPVSVEELHRCLRESTVDKGKVIEMAELKAIRESVLRIRMSDWLQIPEESPWLDMTLKAFVHALRKLWVDGADVEDVTARSNWLVEQIDVRGWAHRLVPENADNVVRIGRATYILLLVTPPTGVQKSVVGAYWNWVEESILAPIHEQFPAIYEWLVDWHRNQIAEMADTQFSLEDDL
jgi:hypothetical protein